MVVNYRNQSYASIKKECLAKGTLFEDSEFPATSKSLYFSKVDNEITWMRPGELCRVPRLVVDGVTCDDLVTGEIKNAWFITACTALAHMPALWKLVVPEHKTQEFDDTKALYAGIFRFQFWRFGETVEVVVDDRLPTKDGKLVFLHSKQRNEFWSALLEKAYAKLFGDYETLGAGHASDALVDFTGGVSEKLELINMKLDDELARKNLFKKLEAASDQKALINCLIRLPKEKPKIGADGPHGLVIGQGYNITMVKTVEVKKSHQAAVGGTPTLQLLRLFNPWRPKEWTGPWSDNSPEWKAISASEWSKMGVKFEDEGEFWMCFDDFLKYFSDADICHFVNTSFFTLKKSWTETICFSEWSAAGRNGGNNWDSLTFLSNPQYMFDIITDGPDVVMVSLEQRDVTEGRIAVGDKRNTIGYYIMKVENNRRYRVHIRGQKMFTSQFLKSRNVFGTCTLPRGRFVIVPCCANAHGAGQFMLRLYTSKATAGKLLNHEAPSAGCCSGKVKLTTTITVVFLDELALPEGSKGALDTYVIVRCEGEKVQADVQKDTKSPVFDLMATFYRKKPDKEPIVIEVYKKNRMFDDFLGEAKIDFPGQKGPVTPAVPAKKKGTEEGDKKVYNLYGKGKEAERMKPGNVTVVIKSSDDPQML